MASKHIRGPEASENYFWYIEDTIGHGATGYVYKCRESKTGKEFAAKVFSIQGMNRPNFVTERELEVLRKFKECKHENIVKIITIEEQRSTGYHTIIMELCAGGSLHNILDKPENAFGFEESEFKQVVTDVVSGMKYLNDQGIIHRDIKPGNILRYIKDDRSSVYKLTDFGAARELKAEEQFMSVYGTEEYLHPDLYEKGVLKQNTAEKKFGANVDLWSLGATFYHIATGKLPFRPFGGRANRNTMYDITSKKKPGIISGIQKERDGAIEWSDKLPEHTRLSSGLKEHMVKILARLLESEPSKAMKFDELFQAVQQNVEMKVIHLYCAQSGTFHMIYANPDDNFARFQELIAIQTGVSARQQDLFYNNDTFKPSSMENVSTYPNTTEDKPILVLGGDSMPSEKLYVQSLLRKTIPRKEVSLENLEADAAVSRVSAINVHWCLHTVKNVERSRTLTLEAAENVITLLKRKARKYLNDAKAIESHCTSMVMKHQACINGCKFEVEVMQTLGNDRDVPQEIVKELEDLVKETDVFKKNVEKLQESMTDPLKKLRERAQKLLSDGELALKWKNMNKEQTHEDYVGVVQNYTEKVDEIMKKFMFRKQNRHRLSSHDMDDHKFERMRLEEYFTKAKEAMDACQSRRQILHENLRTWLEEVYECRAKLKRMREEVESFIEMFNAIADSEEKWRADHMVRMKKVLGNVRAQVRRAISVPQATADKPSTDERDGGDIQSLGSEFAEDINNKLSAISSETKEAKQLMQKSTEKFQRFVQELMEGMNEKNVNENGP